MKKIICALLTVIMLFSLLSLASCGKNDGTPSGMQLVMGGEDVGYYFYGPEEWVVANLGDIGCTYASKVDLSSMTFVKTEGFAGGIEAYFESEKTKFPYEITVNVNGESCNFGNALKPAKKYVYTYTYKEISYTTMQIFVEQGEDSYIFTYTANNVESVGGKTYYERYLEKVSAVIEAFKFTNAVAGEKEEPSYEKDADGYILVTDSTLAGFKMYVPDTYKVDISSSFVSVSNIDGANVTMSQATYTGVYIDDYWQARKDSINAFADKITDPDTNDIVSSLKEIVTKKQIKLDGTNWAIAFEYTYRLDGVDYHVYQVLIVESSVNGYVFTYTATEDKYDSYLGDAESILNKIEY